MAESVEIKRMSLTHHAILDWLILNPEKSMRECAAHFKITQSWLSCVVNSGCFRAELAQRRMEIASVVTQDLPMRLQGVAHLALDNIARHLETSSDPAFALDALDSAMKGINAGKNAGVTLNVNQQNNVQQLFASPEDLAKARELIGRPASGGGTPYLAATPAPEALPRPQQDFFEGGSICEAVTVEAPREENPNS